MLRVNPGPMSPHISGIESAPNTPLTGLGGIPPTPSPTMVRPSVNTGARGPGLFQRVGDKFKNGLKNPAFYQNLSMLMRRPQQSAPQMPMAVNRPQFGRPSMPQMTVPRRADFYSQMEL